MKQKCSCLVAVLAIKSRIILIMKAKLLKLATPFPQISYLINVLLMRLRAYGEFTQKALENKVVDTPQSTNTLCGYAHTPCRVTYTCTYTYLSPLPTLTLFKGFGPHVT